MIRQRSRTPFRFSILIGYLLCAWQFAIAEDVDQNDSSAEIVKSTLKPTRGTPKKSATAEKITPEREAILVAFAEQNHPDLATLMKNLKTKSPPDYQDALNDLDRTVERLFKSREKTPEKYETQLIEWKNLSRVRLLEARFAMNNDPAVEDALRVALTDQLKLKLVAQQVERERLQKRLKKLDQMIDEASANPEALIDKQLSDIRKKMPTSKPAPRSRTKKSAESLPPANDNEKN